MRKNLVSSALRTSAFATACLALAGSNVMASASATPTASSYPRVVAQTYSSSIDSSSFGSGISSPDGSTATNVISFTPVVSGAFTSPSAISLGEFQVATLPAGKETDYNATPFTIKYNPLTVAGQNYSGSPITISGTLTGAITGSQSNVVATFDSVNNPAFFSTDGTFLSTLSLLNSPLALVAPSAGGITTVQAAVATTAPTPAGGGGNNPPTVPEPTTLAILATALVGLGLRKRLRKVD